MTSTMASSSSSSSSAADKVDVNRVLRSPNEDCKNSETQCNEILERQQMTVKMNRIITSSIKFPHKQRLNDLRALLVTIDETNWMYEPVSDMIGCSARTRSAQSSHFS